MLKKNILFLLHTPPPVHGSSIVGEFIKSSSIINDKFSCRYINLLASKKISDSGYFSITKIINFLIVLLKLNFELIFQRPKITYLALSTTGFALYKDLIIVIILKNFRIKRVYHLHNKGVSLNSNHRIKKMIYKFIFKDADVIILSKHLYYDIQEFVPTDKLHICPNGVENIKVHDKIKKTDHINILFLSNLIESKGVFILLEALSLVKSENIEFQATFVGNEGDISKDKFNEVLKVLNLTENVKYLGAKYSSEKEEILNQSDIFVFPTYYPKECFPLVLLEAMQFSLPIISTYEGGIADIVESDVNGFLVKQKNIEELVDKLKKLIHNKDLREEMGRNSREKFITNFTLEKFENNMIKILDNIN